MDIINSDETKGDLVEHGNVVDPKTQVTLSSTPPENDSAVRHEHIRRRLVKAQVVETTHPRRIQKVKKNLPLTSPTQSRVDSEYTFSHSTFFY